MHGNSVYANMVDGVVPTPPADEDTVVKSVLDKYQERSEIGKLKYGKTLDRKDLTMKQWLTHLQEELMDATLYLEKIMSLDKAQDASENLREALTNTIKQNVNAHLTRANTLGVVHERLWFRVLSNPNDPESYKYTEEEIKVIQTAAHSFLSGDLGNSTPST